MNILEDPTIWIEQVVSQSATAVEAYLPKLAGALIIILLGWSAARVARWVTLRFGKGLDALLAAFHRRAGREPVRLRWALSGIVAAVAFWLVVFWAVIGASEILGLTAMARWLRELVGYLPRLLISGLILFIGYLVSGGVRDLIAAVAESGGFKHALLLGRVVAGIILAFTLLLALDEVGLDVTLLANIITLAAASIFGSAALAFGLGAGDSVRNIMASHYLRKIYRPGQTVQIREYKGEILELTPVAVVIETDEGAAVVPARLFTEQVSVLRDDEEESNA